MLPYVFLLRCFILRKNVHPDHMINNEQVLDLSKICLFFAFAGNIGTAGVKLTKNWQLFFPGEIAVSD